MKAKKLLKCCNQGTEDTMHSSNSQNAAKFTYYVPEPQQPGIELLQHKDSIQQQYCQLGKVESFQLQSSYNKSNTSVLKEYGHEINDLL